MALADIEITTHGGNPIELYDIVLNGGDVAAYYLTDHNAGNLGVLSQTYTAIPIRRSNITIANPADVRPLRVEIPFDQDVARELAIRLPPRSATLTLRRYHGDIGDVGIIWTGPIKRCRIENRTLTFEVPNLIAEALKAEIATSKYQAACNHQLYSADCGIDRLNHDTAATIATISATDPRIITISSFGAATPSEHKGGEIVRTADGERRTITAVSGTTLTLMRAFRTLAVSDAVTVFEGCPHTIAACNSQFANATNFGGFPYVQSIDLFKVGVRGVRS